MKNLYTADFETTTIEDDCRVWLWGLYDIIQEKFNYGNSIDSFFINLQQLPNKSKVYFHNLKFDGEFLFYWLFENGFVHSRERDLNNYEFSTLINHMGTFYGIKLQFPNRTIQIYDSLKIIPLTVEKMSKSFGVEQVKGEIDYNKIRPIGYKPDNDEIEYVKNDVVIVGKSLLTFFEQKLTKMTQASNALQDYKRIITPKQFDRWFPSLDSIDAELRQSYKGGFTYVNPRYQDQLLGTGIVLDVNSLYPSVMYHCKLPYGEPVYYDGEYKEDKIYSIYIQMLRCQFELKEGYLPTIQLKHDRGFIPTEYVTSSAGHDITLCLTSVDLELFLEHYEVYNLDYISGWKFKASDQLFKAYIDKWGKVKEESSINGNEGLRTLAKLMMNALYGKFGLNPNVKSKFPIYENGLVKYVNGEQEYRDPIYIPIASFVTAYARRTTIQAGQKNIERFIYADTDSLHLVGEDIPTNLSIDPVKLGYWKHEGTFSQAKFLRAKSYVEVIDGKLHVTCAGMPKRCHVHVTLENFKGGEKVPGKLQHHRVKGGVILKEVDFTIKM